MSERLVMVAKGSLWEMRALAERCGEEGIEVSLRRCSGRSWGAQLELLVEEPEVPEVAELMRSEWRQLVAKEGIAEPAAVPREGEDLGCPACGSTAPLVGGACAECGLQLA